MISPKPQEQVLKLIQEKERIEKEIQRHGVVLKNNNIGFNEPLVDDEGFPRNDIDVRSVRLARTQIVCLQNDLKDIMKAIEGGLEKYFTEKNDIQCSSIPHFSKISLESKTQILPNNELKPFLIVSMVSENSPGSIAGIQTNDRILNFGSINCKNFIDLKQIGELVNNSKNQHIKIKLRRNESDDLELILSPKIWTGQGLLGFKVNVIPV
ncbi:26S proteasome non-ATPase regulatory subunit 9 [Chironomus tepperi]|uniref:26S proteasome non-ATPase regulatory subunit 9 n=1 Tax=Chironomus tepperi TaxID=113505 RepID=UPI00391F7AA3